jgi:hypothetical protein
VWDSLASCLFLSTVLGSLAGQQLTAFVSLPLHPFPPACFALEARCRPSRSGALSFAFGGAHHARPGTLDGLATDRWLGDGVFSWGRRVKKILEPHFGSS